MDAGVEERKGIKGKASECEGSRERSVLSSWVIV